MFIVLRYDRLKREVDDKAKVYCCVLVRTPKSKFPQTVSLRELNKILIILSLKPQNPVHQDIRRGYSILLTSRLGLPLLEVSFILINCAELKYPFKV